VSRLTRILIAVVALAGAGFGYWKFDLQPKRAEAAKLETEVSTKEAELAQTQALIETYEGARAAYKENYSTVVRLGKAVPSDDDTKSLVVQLDAAAQRSGVDFDTLNLNGNGGGAAGSTDTAPPVAPGAVNAGAFSAMPFTLSFSGDFATLGNFMSRLDRFVTLKSDKIEVNGRLMRVEKFQLVPNTEAGWPHMVATIGAASYIVPETPAVDAAAGATSQAATGTTSAGTASTTATDIR
jgi:Tfp pilus assembly protein PilO